MQTADDLSDLKFTLAVYSRLTFAQLNPRSEELSGFVLHTLGSLFNHIKKQILDFVKTAINADPFNSGKPVQVAVKKETFTSVPVQNFIKFKDCSGKTA